jgi:hypothetical protein
MKELLDEMQQINTFLVLKVSETPNFTTLSRRKIEICDKLITEYLQPHINKRNAFIQAHPRIKMPDDFSPMLKSFMSSEIRHTQAALDDHNYTIPEPVIIGDVPPGKSKDQQIQEILQLEEKQINEANKLLGGKIFLKRGDYLERVQIAKTPLESHKKFVDMLLDRDSKGPKSL